MRPVLAVEVGGCVLDPDHGGLFGRVVARDRGRRGAGGTWTIVPVDEEAVSTDDCPEQLTQDATCTEEREQLVGLAVVAGRSGDIGVLYQKLHTRRTLVAKCCDPRAPYTCQWGTGAHQSESQLLVAWVDDGGGVRRAPLLSSGILAQGGTAVVDAAGDVHLVLYDAHVPEGDPTDEEESDGTVVRYLRLGAR